MNEEQLRLLASALQYFSAPDRERLMAMDPPEDVVDLLKQSDVSPVVVAGLLATKVS